MPELALRSVPAYDRGRLLPNGWHRDDQRAVPELALRSVPAYDLAVV